MNRLLIVGFVGMVLLLAAFASSRDAPADASETFPSLRQASDTIPAFPEARGHGARALEDCRDLPLVVRQVTSFDSTGAGSFRNTLEATHPDTFDIITFSSGGDYELGPNNPSFDLDDITCVYVAGQTAPGGGVQFTGGSRIKLNRSENLVMRYFRISHPGNMALFLQGAENVVIDHITSRWNKSFSGGHNIFYIYGSTSDAGIAGCSTSDPCPVRWVTLSNLMGYEPHEDHPTIMHISGEETAKADSALLDVTVFGNFFLNAGQRFPLIRSQQNRVLSTVVYNARNRNIEAQHEAEVDYIDNYVKIGPGIGSGEYRQRSFAMRNTEVDKSVFASGNRDAFTDFVPLVDTALIWGDTESHQVTCNMTDASNCNSQGDPAPLSWKRDVPLEVEFWPAFPLGLDSIGIEALFDHVGMSQRLNCDGSWEMVRDSIDSAKIDQFWAGTGPDGWIDVDTVPNAPTPDAGTACADDDEDGIPDAWELEISGSATGVRADSVSVSGYLMIEHYLNGSDPDDPTPWASDVTYDNDCRVYGVSLTAFGRGWRADRTRVPTLTTFKGLRRWGTQPDSMIILTLDDLGPPLDSSSVDARLSDWLSLPDGYAKGRCPS